jgi:predicted MPP superfamily phosphohydrolase
MRTAFFIFVLIIIGIVELYIYRGLKSTFGVENKKLFTILYFSSILITFGGIILFFLNFYSSAGVSKILANVTFGIGFSILVAKLLLVPFYLSEDIFRVLKYIFQSIFSDGNTHFASRLRILTYAGTITASIPMLLLMYGVVKGKYDFKIYRKEILFTDLPKSFNGFKIIQLSDMHLGSFDSREKVAEAVDKIIALNPDILLFTGDMVNNTAQEAIPYIDLFKKIQPPYGKYSVLGNHDYAHYVKWKDSSAYEANMQKLFEIHKKMGFRLLMNENIRISNKTDSICIAGVENWGLKPFPQYGILEKAVENIQDSEFTILLSHDPTHWDEIVKKYPKKIHLTLSGHTHGMQIGIEAFGIKWSPVQLKYKKWSDLFEENNKYLYINRGFGFIGYPGRIGIWPEITEIILRTKQQ